MWVTFKLDSHSKLIIYDCQISRMCCPRLRLSVWPTWTSTSSSAKCRHVTSSCSSIESDTATQEYFADYAPVTSSLFSLNHYPNASKPLYGDTPDSWDPAALTRSVQGITAVLLSLKKKPVIRYERMSGMARKLALEVNVRPRRAASFTSPGRLPLAAHRSERDCAFRFQVDAGSTSTSHRGSKKRSCHAATLPMDLSSDGPRTHWHTKRSR